MVEISVILRVHKEVKYLPLALRSALNQTFQDFEIIIVDDCAPTPEKIRRIIARFDDRRIRYIRNPKRYGAMKSMLIGFNYAKGKYLANLDYDDILLPQNLEINYNYLKTTPPKVAAVFGKCALINKSSVIFSSIKKNRKLLPAKKIRIDCLSAPFQIIDATSFMIKKEALVNLNKKFSYIVNSTADIKQIFLAFSYYGYDILHHCQYIGLFRRHMGSNITTPYAIKQSKEFDDFYKLYQLYKNHKIKGTLLLYLFYYLIGTLVKATNIISSRYMIGPLIYF
jgi:glycosyltransferase involved in cell wall biosynthesis